ncbi:protein unc-119 homolog B isoform X2 [Solea solea]|uniref:protein unc-119 homolog B isoform X2 n=1 Tax=Solea solea TaxID=90069 RepID=UPI00272A3093|nr:protein unc-119 homolog B isoform X2 [Solea solea]
MSYSCTSRGNSQDTSSAKKTAGDNPGTGTGGADSSGSNDSPKKTTAMRVKKGCNSTEAGVPMTSEEDLLSSALVTPEDVLGLQKITETASLITGSNLVEHVRSAEDSLRPDYLGVFISVGVIFLNVLSDPRLPSWTFSRCWKLSLSFIAASSQEGRGGMCESPQQRGCRLESLRQHEASPLGYSLWNMHLCSPTHFPFDSPSSLLSPPLLCVTVQLCCHFLTLHHVTLRPWSCFVTLLCFVSLLVHIPK